jgi:ParB family chromosome partitioning protein
MSGDEPFAGGHAFARDRLQHAGRDDVLRELHEPQQRERRLLCGLQDLHVAGGERGAELPHRHHQRVVPRADAGDDPDRLAPDHRGVALDVLAGRLALEVAGRAGEETQVVGCERHLVA